jgi:hypothetical protein
MEDPMLIEPDFMSAECYLYPPKEPEWEDEDENEHFEYELYQAMLGYVK